MVDTLPEWRLDDLYAGRDDPRIEADLDKARKAAAELKVHEGQLIADRAAPEALGRRLDAGIALYEVGTNALFGVGAYASLSASTARDNPAWAKFEADFRAKAAQIGAETLWFTLEINQLEDDELEGDEEGVGEEDWRGGRSPRSREGLFVDLGHFR